MKPWIVCVGEHGRAVLYGRCEEQPVPGEPMPKMEGVRMVIRWDTRGLFALAAHGPKKAESSECRLSAAVPFHANGDQVKQVLGVTEEAAAAIDAWPDA